MQFQFWLEYAQLHLISLEQDWENNKTDYLIGQIEATKHLIGVANDINNGALFLTTDTEFDTINKTVEGKQMSKMYVANVNGDWWELTDEQHITILDLSKFNEAQIATIEQEYGEIGGDKFADTIVELGDTYVLNDLFDDVVERV